MAQSDPDVDLSQLRWKHRIVVAVSDTDTNPSLVHLKDEISNQQEAFLDRDMVLIELVGEKTGTIDGRMLNAGTIQQLRDRFRVENEAFCVYLIGKDGGIKVQGDTDTRLDDLFALIDTMPMRRNEMKNKHRKGGS